MHHLICEGWQEWPGQIGPGRTEDYGYGAAADEDEGRSAAYQSGYADGVASVREEAGDTTQAQINYPPSIFTCPSATVVCPSTRFDCPTRLFCPPGSTAPPGSGARPGTAARASACARVTRSARAWRAAPAWPAARASRAAPAWCAEGCRSRT
ncbi:hypothetical protein G7085_00870 [Tessaracoccus sp. HDW20]|uniref:hypothetical protein n=1 Tax=Tessaracoccus coleopterorum TaxID=2714950 RepID=UPI0018D45848|nr:hypothetical protein [Tessaracoccus coleopterorum]NHB83741.1 hypothetical protein [Tessaracoccus coleopterorum]